MIEETRRSGSRLGLAACGGLLLLTWTVGSPVRAAVWNVYPDGSGDVPTMQAAVDAAATADVTRLWPGDYIERVWVYQKSLSLEAAQGPGTARF